MCGSHISMSPAPCSSESTGKLGLLGQGSLERATVPAELGGGTFVSLSCFGPLHFLHLLLCRPCRQRPDPPHSLHLLFCRPCMQREEPPHSMQWHFCRPCMQIEEPPHSLQSCFCRLCTHKPDPPHSLQKRLCRACGHIEEPPHFLHCGLCRPCGHIPRPPHSLHLLLCRPCGQERDPSRRCLTVRSVPSLSIPSAFLRFGARSLMSAAARSNSVAAMKKFSRHCGSKEWSSPLKASAKSGESRDRPARFASTHNALGRAVAHFSRSGMKFRLQCRSSPLPFGFAMADRPPEKSPLGTLGISVRESSE